MAANKAAAEPLPISESVGAITAPLFAEPAVEPPESVSAAAEQPNNTEKDASDILPRFYDVANAPSGYAIGNFTRKDTLEYSGVSQKEARGKYLLVKVNHEGHEEDDDCAWAKLGDVNTSGVKIKQNPGVCTEQAPKIDDFHEIGKNLNCKPHECAGGAPRSKLLNKYRDNLYLNRDKEGEPYGKLPIRTNTRFRYRYTTKDGDLAMGSTVVKIPRGKGRKPIKDNVWVYVKREGVKGDLDDGPKLDPNHG